MPNDLNLWQQILSTGVVGAMLIISLLVIRFLYNELSATKEKLAAAHIEHGKELATEKDRRIDDTQKQNGVLLANAKEQTIAIQALTHVTERIEDTNKEKERLERELAMRAIPTPVQTFSPIVPKKPPPR